jgi:cysteine desulfurase/selenocysteine lyase
MASALPRLDEIVEEFAELTDGTERLEYLIELGDCLTAFPEAARTESNRVQGCQSNVWLVLDPAPTVVSPPVVSPAGASSTGASSTGVTSPVEPRLRFLADSDAPMVRGLVAILLAAFSNHTPREILAFGVEPLFERLKLRTFLSPMRSNGLHSMVLFVRSIAEQAEAARIRLQTPAAAASENVSGSASVSGSANVSGSADVSGGAHASSESLVMPVPNANPPRGAAAQSAAMPSSAQLVERLTDAEVAALRDDFPILGTTVSDGLPLVYLDNAATTQRPRAVIDAMREAYECYFSNVHRGGHTLAARTTERYEGARESVRRLLNAARKHEVIFTSGTTASVNLVANSWGLANVRAGDEILLTIMEHHSNIVPWQQLAARTRCRLRFAPLTADGRLDLDAWSGMLNERTRLAAFTAVSNVLGTVNPIHEMTRRAHAADAVVMVDAAQAAPHERLDVRQLDADFVAFSGHKMLGPAGIGVLYGKEALLEAMPPFLGGGSMIRSVTTDGFEPAMLPAKFEAGTPPIVDAIALGAAIEYLERIGLDRIHQHELRLCRAAHTALAGIDGVELLGPAPEHKGGIATFTMRGAHADEIAKVLDTCGVAVRAGHHCAMPLHERLGVPASCRASFYFYNTLEEVERFAESLRTARRLFDRAAARASRPHE